MNKCFIKACVRPEAQRTRGLCLICYKQAKVKVEAGEVTWDRLGQLGLCKPDTDNPFDEAYKQALEDHEIPF